MWFFDFPRESLQKKKHAVSALHKCKIDCFQINIHRHRSNPLFFDQLTNYIKLYFFQNCHVFIQPLLNRLTGDLETEFAQQRASRAKLVGQTTKKNGTGAADHAGQQSARLRSTLCHLPRDRRSRARPLVACILCGTTATILASRQVRLLPLCRPVCKR